MIIDSHINITHNGKWFNTDHDASLERLLGEMDEAGIDKCLLISMPQATTNKYISSVVERYPDKFRGLGHIEFSKGLKGQVDEILNMGLSGIKIHPRTQGVNCMDPTFEPLFDYLNERHLTLMIDGYYQTCNPGIILDDLTPFRYDGLAKKYKDMKIILSHMGGHRVMDAFFLAKSNSNVYPDNSHVLKYFKGTSIISDCLWVMDNLDEKIIYGSDFPEYRLNNYRNHFEDIIKTRPSLRKEMIFTNILKLIDFP